MVIGITYDDSFRKYDFGSSHPFKGDRYTNFMQLFNKILLDKGEFNVIKPEKASVDDLLLVHSQDYIDKIINGCQKSCVYDLDTPLHPNLEDAARIITGSSLTAGKLVMEKKFNKAIGIGGGMHHAKKETEGGFCIYNDVAILTKKLLFHYKVKRVLILDTDVHAGDGTSDIFYSDPNVLLIDIHQDPLTLYPGTGFINQIGESEGKGYTVNVPLPPGSTDETYKIVLTELFKPLALEFQPDIIIRNGGSDPHFADLLSSMGLTLQGFKMIGQTVRQVASEVTNGKVIDLPGSGYNLKVLPYAWCSLIIGLAGLNMNLKEPIPLIEDKKKATLNKIHPIITKIKNRLKPYWQDLNL